MRPIDITKEQLDREIRRYQTLLRAIDHALAELEWDADDRLALEDLEGVTSYELVQLLAENARRQGIETHMLDLETGKELPF